MISLVSLQAEFRGKALATDITRKWSITMRLLLVIKEDALLSKQTATGFTLVSFNVCKKKKNQHKTIAYQPMSFYSLLLVKCQV